MMFLGLAPNSGEAILTALFCSLLFGWKMFDLKYLTIDDNGLTVNSIFNKRLFCWTDVSRIELLDMSNMRVLYFILYVHRKNSEINKVYLFSMLWFERKTLIAELQKHVRVDKDPPMPKLTDIW